MVDTDQRVADTDQRVADTARHDAPRKRVVWRVLLVLVVLAAVGVTSVVLLRTTSILGPGDHGGEEVAEPSAEAVAEGLDAATSEIHAHLNWLIWGPPGARTHPDFARLIDAAIAEAQERGEEEIVQLLRATRDAALKDGELLRAHDLAEDAETIAHSGSVDREELYVDEPDADAVDEPDADAVDEVD